MNLRERMGRNIARAGSKAGEPERLADASTLALAGLRASAVTALTGLPAHTVKMLIDRDVGVRRSGRQPGSIERLQDDSALRLACTVFLHAYLKAREHEEPLLSSRAFVRALATLGARSPEHGVSADLLFYAVQQYGEGTIGLERCAGCGAHFLKILVLKDAKRTLTGDCFACSYRFHTPGRAASWSGRELLSFVHRQPEPAG